MADIEMPATAVALNLEGSPRNVKEEAADKNPMVAAVIRFRHLGVLHHEILRRAVLIIRRFLAFDIENLGRQTARAGNMIGQNIAGIRGKTHNRVEGFARLAENSLP